MLMMLSLAMEGALLAAQGVGLPGPVVRDPNAPLLLGLEAPKKKDRLAHLPSATVEVMGVGEREAEQIKSFTRWITPELQAAALKGYSERESVQMLTEFMLQDPSRPKVPGIRAFPFSAYAPSTVPKRER